jgi:hypothetical protein
MPRRLSDLLHIPKKTAASSGFTQFPMTTDDVLHVTCFKNIRSEQDMIPRHRLICLV